MLEVYSLGIDVLANGDIPFNNVSIKKGCTAELASPNTINLNKCGVYMISLDASASAVTTIQMYKDGVAQAQAQSTSSSSPSFVTLVQVEKSNSPCPCASPTQLQFYSENAVTLDSVNVCVTKLT